MQKRSTDLNIYDDFDVFNLRQIIWRNKSDIKISLLQIYFDVGLQIIKKSNNCD